MKKLMFITLSAFITNNTALAATVDSHPETCEELRYYTNENCSEEPNTFKIVDGEIISINRTYQECYEQDFKSNVDDINKHLTEKLNTYMSDELGIDPAKNIAPMIICQLTEQ